MSKMSSGDTRLTIIIKKRDEGDLNDTYSLECIKAKPDTWGLISKTLNQQDKKIKKHVGQIKKKWHATNRLPRRDLLEKLSKSKTYELSSSNLYLDSFNDSLEYKGTPRTSSQANQTIILSPKTFFLGIGESVSTPSSISLAEETLSSPSDGWLQERQQLEKEIHQLRQENQMYLAAKAALIEKRKLISRERELLANQRKKLEFELRSPTSHYNSSYNPKQWNVGRPGW